ncbi:unnamed protein product, partial [Rotaria socialis]
KLDSISIKDSSSGEAIAWAADAVELLYILSVASWSIMFE